MYRSDAFYKSDSFIVILIFLLGVFLGATVAVTGPVYKAGKETYQAITECEASLPRDQHCDYVITARAVEGEE